MYRAAKGAGRSSSLPSPLSDLGSDVAIKLTTQARPLLGDSVHTWPDPMRNTPFKLDVKC